MNGASREALAAARERLDALTDNTSVDAAKLAGELASVTALLDREVSLRRVLTDPAQSGESKAELAARLLGGQVGGETVDLVSGLVRSRWSRSRDLVDSIEELANTADLTAAQRGGRLDDVEDELFRFGRIVGSDMELRSALTSRTATASAKSELLRSLLGGKAQPVTERIIVRLVTQPRGRSLEAGLDALSKLAAERRNRTVAVVTSAVPLSDRQKQRLGAALAKLYGREMHLNLDVDPSVLGGVSVRVGDEVINGTVAERLEEATPAHGRLTRRRRTSKTSGPVGPCRNCRRFLGVGPQTPLRNFGPNKESREPRWRSSRSGRRRSGTHWITLSSRTSRTRPRARRSVRSALPATASRRWRVFPPPWRTSC
ncbi:F-type H+-transporting ATPase subunit delta [Streptomyces sp. V2I9]|nr:F-type H+-transporting ATPase subunit delta [Streptomyces sp. V2I9]